MNTNTVGHELSHTLDAAMYQRKNELKQNKTLSEQEQKFIDALLKFGNIEALLKFSKTPKNLQAYRMSPNEARAHGVGNFIEWPRSTAVINEEGPHIDSTMATEAAILRDLYKRSFNK